MVTMKQRNMTGNLTKHDGMKNVTKKRCAVLGIIAKAKGSSAQQPWTAQGAGQRPRGFARWADIVAQRAFVAPRVARAKPLATAVLPCSATTLAHRLAKYASAGNGQLSCCASGEAA